jgi:hypothetical protein
MPVTINLGNTLISGSYFSGGSAELFIKETIPRLVTTQSIGPANSRVDQVNLSFNALAAGTYQCIIKRQNKTAWRSPVFEVITGTETINLSVLRVPPVQATLRATDIQSRIPLPIEIAPDMTDPNRLLDETIALDELIIDIFQNAVKTTGKGRIFNSNNFSFITTDFTFDYFFTINPTDSADPKKLVKIIPQDPINIRFTNPLTGFISLFVKDTINDQIRKAVTDKLNQSINDTIDAQLSGIQLTDAQKAIVTSTVLDVTINDTGEEIRVRVPGGGTLTKKIFAIAFDVDISLPSEVISDRVSGGGCLNTAVVLGCLVVLLLRFVL